MKALKIFVGIAIATSLAAFTLVSCDEKKTRAEIEKDFADGGDSDDYDEFSTSEKRTASSSDPSAFGGTLPTEMTEEQKKKLEEEKKKQESEAAERKKNAEEESNSDDSDNKSSAENSSESTPVSSERSQSVPTESSKPTETKKVEQTSAPAKPVVSEPAKQTVSEQPAARQQVIVTKSEPKKRDIVVDGQAQ